MKPITIRDIKTIATAPMGASWLIVLVETSEPGITGIGCASFRMRYHTVITTIERYLKPLLIGRDVSEIEDIWQTSMVQSYWRNSPVFNSAMAGIDIALWDIKGKMANMPVYQLLGGKSRPAAAVYSHADGRDLQEVGDNFSKFREQGYKFIRCQLGGYGGKVHEFTSPDNVLPGNYFDPQAYAKSVIKLFDYIRENFGTDIELMHDVHNRLSPIDVIKLARNLEPHNLFWLEDAFPPELLDWYTLMRQHTLTPQAVGEIFTHPREWEPLINDRLIDFIRLNITKVGGITPGKKIAAKAESNGVRLGSYAGCSSPVAVAATLHVNLNAYSFGAMEWNSWKYMEDVMSEMFPGLPQVRNGYMYANDQPGLGIGINEKMALKFPCPEDSLGMDVHDVPLWTTTRTPDGSSTRP